MVAWSWPTYDPTWLPSLWQNQDFKWQDFADDYLTYVLPVVRWGDGQRSARRLQDFGSWFKETGRRDPSLP